MHHPIWTNCSEAIALVSTEGYLRDVNPACARTFGQAPERLTSRPFAELIHPEDAWNADATMARVRRGVGELRFEHRVIRPDGGERLISWSAAPQGDMFYAIGRDVTDERARTQAGRLEAIGELSAGVAHDVNNLLAVVLGGAESFERGVARGEVAVRLAPGVARMKTAVTRGARLTASLLAFAGRQTLHPMPVDIGRVIGRLGVASIVPRETLRAMADPVQLDAALQELVANGIDAGGSVTISAADIGTHIRIEIADTGHGMSVDIKSRACEPFFTTKLFGQGAGLGLSRALGFARQSGGDLKIESQPGSGTIVRLTLPRAAPAN